MSVSRWRRDFRKFRSSLPQSVRDDSDFAFAAFLEERRRRIVNSPLFESTPAGHAQAQRLAGRVKQAIIKSYFQGRSKRRIIKDPELLLYRVKPDPLRDTICPRFLKNWKGIPDRLREKKRGHVQLKDFSFIRDPVGALAQIKKVIEAAGQFLYIQLDFLDTNCDDIAPYIVLAHVMRSLPNVFIGGSITGEMTGVLQSVGLDRALGINRITVYRERSPLVLPFKMASRVPPGFFGDRDHLLRPQYKEFIADRFCNALEKWLSIHKLELTPEAAGSITSSITEALDNAERHGRPEVDGGMGDWSMAGFSKLQQDQDGQFRLHCSFSIVSIGATIGESLQTAAPDIQSRITSYVDQHAKGNPPATRRLRTVMALQDGVTRVTEASSGRRGGVGLMTLVNMIGVVGGTDVPGLQSVFAIISGDTCLRITHPYDIGIPPPGSTLRELWFNAQNRATGAPDPNHVFSLPDSFGGTVLSASFTIDPDYIHRKIADEHIDHANDTA